MAKDEPNSREQEHDPEAENSEAQQGPQIFPTIGDPEAEAAEEAAESGEDTRTERERLLEQQLEQQRNDLEAREKAAEEREARMQAMLERMSAAPSQGVAQGASGNPQSELPADDSDLGEAPDPVNDPKGYHQYMEKLVDRRAKRQAEQIAQQTTQQQTTQKTMDDLWSKFQSRHGDVAKHDIVVEGVVRREFERMRGAGSDPMQAIMADPDAFVDRVANESKRYLEERGVPLQTSGEGETQTKPSASRTAGIDGSTQTGGRGSGKSNEKPSSFMDELKRQQVNSGFF